ncbi:hypothetical protein [Scytonema millei]|uniref:Uncharacterized protein n=1 Tax=Scytonema millei VB511283 TaxID=1245923 RepID=A0A9X5I6X5_9CYAN|nr:hypothetical protein [Scytonema millei]NHC37576.1 hypothetical protein [Scytonema millei VB511283]
MSQIYPKRKRATIVILATIFAAGIVTTTPATNLELFKQIFLTVADVAMCTVVWDIYFDEELATKDTKSILLELGLISIICAVTAFITAKAVLALLGRLVILVGAFGWVMAGIVASITTAILGIAWLFYCDDLYRHSNH